MQRDARAVPDGEPCEVPPPLRGRRNAELEGYEILLAAAPRLPGAIVRFTGLAASARHAITRA
jgi:hypothetical protein